ncbi:MAG: DUF3592 domain-containing protein [Oscillospiraceae bacterium]
MEKYKYDRYNLIFGLAFCVVAVLVLYAGVSNVFKWNKFQEKAVEVSAVITDIDKRVSRKGGKSRKRTYDVDIVYQYEGKEYSGDLGYYIEGMKTGDTVTIYVDPDDPEITMSEPWNGLVISIILSLVATGISMAFLIHEFSMKKYIDGLIEADKYVFAECTCENRSGLKVNGVAYNCAELVYIDDSGEKFYFQSHPYPPDTHPYSPGEKVKVYVDIENKPRRGYVSTQKQE